MILTIGERIQYIRKDLNMSQKTFGDTVGVSRDVVNNMEHDRPEAKEHMLRLISKTHNVNYFWLTEEKGDVYLSPPSIIMNDVIDRYNLDDVDVSLSKEYVKLDPDVRNAIKQLIINVVKKAPDD